MTAIIAHLQSLVANVGPFFILLGILIFVHELGHFLVAKFFGVRVETFSLGFGKKILSVKRGDTTYCLSLIPLGGYVKMYGDDPSNEVPVDQRQFAFLKKPIGQRIAVVLAGPLMNLFFAALVFITIGWIGEDVASPTLGDVSESSAAFKAGFRSGDKIIKVNRSDVQTWSVLQDNLEKVGGKAATFLVERRGETQPLEFEAGVSIGENGNLFSPKRQVGQIEGLTQESRSTVIGIRDPKSPSGLAGIESLQMLVSINGEKISFWRDVQPMLLKNLTSSNSTVELGFRSVEAAEGDANTKKIKLEVPKNWNEKTDLAASLGLEPAELYIYQVKKDSPADKAGLKIKDRVVRINHQDVWTWSEVLNQVKTFDPANTDGLEFTVSRDGQELNFKIKPEMTSLMSTKGQEEKRFTVGIVSGFFPMGSDPVHYKVRDPVALFTYGAKETVYWTQFVVMSMVRLIQGEVSPKNIGGVISIGRVASHSFAAGLTTFLRMMALISINLFLLNLLPIPILDGGHLVFYAIEGLRGAPISLRKMEIAQQVGLMLLMSLMAFAFFNDITNLFATRW